MISLCPEQNKIAVSRFAQISAEEREKKCSSIKKLKVNKGADKISLKGES